MIPVRLEMDLDCVDYLVHVERDVYLPLVAVGLDLEGLFPENHHILRTIKSVSCNLPGRFVTARIGTIDYREAEPGCPSQRKDEVLPEYIEIGWRVAYTESWGVGPELNECLHPDYTPWFGGPPPPHLA